jgi:integrase
MTTLSMVIDGMIASREWDAATLSRLKYWYDVFGSKDIANITPDEVDTALVSLAKRGKMRPTRGGQCKSSGESLAPSSFNRYITQLQSIYRYAKRLRILPRTFVSPATGIEKEPEPINPERYFRPEEVERLLTIVRLLDTRWGKMEALILVAYHTGLRVGNIKGLTWGDVDLVSRTAKVGRTKNGEPIVSVMSETAAAALQKLPGKHHPDELIFSGPTGHAFHFRRLWLRCTTEAGLEGKNFHQLRHGCGHAMAVAGVNQAQIMSVLGHKTLTASARYMHHNTADKKRVVDQVFS